MPYVITTLCTNDGSCVEVCPVSCIHTTPGAPQFYIDPDVCIDCEQCEIVCPVDAIFKDIDLPAEHAVSLDLTGRKHRIRLSLSRKHSISCGDDAYAHAIGGFAATQMLQLFDRDRRNVDLDIDAIEQRPGDAAVIAGHLIRRAPAARLAEIAAGTLLWCLFAFRVPFALSH